MEDKLSATKLLVIGLDGATFSILQPLMDSGRMPFLARLAATGTMSSLHSTLPPVTAPAWSSFSTGKNPGKHGLFGWKRPLDSKLSPKREWVSSHDIQADKIWHMLSQAGYKIGVMNVPMTYPPEAVNGFMISGMLTPGPESPFTYPPTLKKELFQLVPEYTIDVDIMRAERELKTAADEVFNDFIASVRKAAHLRTTAAIKLVQKYQSDILFIVYTLPDRLQHPAYHYMLEAAKDPETPSPRARSSIQTLIALDQELQRLVSSIADENTLIIILSDHGFCHHRYSVYLNGWLSDQGLLKYRRQSASLRQALRTTILKVRKAIPGSWIRIGRQALSAEKLIDWSSTKAYCGHATENGIYISLEEREAFGIVEREEYQPLRDYIKRGLSKLVNPLDKQPIFKAVYLREEAYQGPYVHFAPDIVFDLQEGYKAVPTPSLGFQVEDVANARSGTHDMSGILMASGSMIQPGARIENASIVDITPTILYAMNLPILASMDGQVLKGIFREEYRKKAVPRIRYEETTKTERPADAHRYNGEEATEIEERLRNLGYID